MLAEAAPEGAAPLTPLGAETVHVNCTLGVVELNVMETCVLLQMVSLLTNEAEAIAVGFTVIV